MNEKLFHHAFLFSGINFEKKNAALASLIVSLLGKEYALSPDFYTIESDPITIEEIRNLKARTMLTALQGAYKVFLINGIEKVTHEAAASLLKILEEPPQKTVFIATTTHVRAVSPMIRSRFSHTRFPSEAPYGASEGKPASFLENLLKLPYHKRFQEVPKLLEENTLESVLTSALFQESKKMRVDFKNTKKVEQLLRIQRQYQDPTANKKLLGEYALMIL